MLQEEGLEEPSVPTGVVATNPEPAAGAPLAALAETVCPSLRAHLPSCGPEWAQVMRVGAGFPVPPQCGERIHVDAKGEKSICSSS